MSATNDVATSQTLTELGAATAIQAVIIGHMTRGNTRRMAFEHHSQRDLDHQQQRDLNHQRKVELKREWDRNKIGAHEGKQLQGAGSTSPTCPLPSAMSTPVSKVATHALQVANPSPVLVLSGEQWTNYSPISMLL